MLYISLQLSYCLLETAGSGFGWSLTAWYKPGTIFFYCVLAVNSSTSCLLHHYSRGFTQLTARFRSNSTYVALVWHHCLHSHNFLRVYLYQTGTRSRTWQPEGFLCGTDKGISYTCLSIPTYPGLWRKLLTYFCHSGLHPVHCYMTPTDNVML